METLINRDGAIVYIIRKCIPPVDAIKLCEKLRKEVPWHNDIVTVRGKDYPQHRRTYACGEFAMIHEYSGTKIPVEVWIPEVKEIRNKVQRELDINFNSCLLNEYMDGMSYISYHSDREAMGPNNAVVTVSLGGSRDFYFKYKGEPHETIKTTLHNGDLVLMYGNTQKLWTHSIPKRVHADYRISLTYRLLI